MHELSIAEGILGALKEQVKGRIISIKLRIGEMSGVVPSALKFSFEIVSKGTMAEGATLYIENVPLTAKCGDCLETFLIKDYCFECSLCGGSNFRVIAGRELLIDEVEVERI
jgi:hydrogenase nickel incorporation protein HypA/HybF